MPNRTSGVLTELRFGLKFTVTRLLVFTHLVTVYDDIMVEFISLCQW